MDSQRLSLRLRGREWQRNREHLVVQLAVSSDLQCGEQTDSLVDAMVRYNSSDLFLAAHAVLGDINGSGLSTFALGDAATIVLTDTGGRAVGELVAEATSGSRSFSTASLSPGEYFVTIRAAGRSATARFVLP